MKHDIFYAIVYGAAQKFTDASVRESVQLLKAHGANLAGILVGMDRQEKGLGTPSTKSELERDFGVPVVSLLNLDQLIGSIASEDFQGKGLVSPEIKEKIVAYRASWGGESPDVSL